jgi:gluconolactonase
VVRAAGVASVAAALVALAAPGAAHAIAPCPGAGAVPVTVLSGQPLLESVIVDARGRLYYTDTGAGALRRLDHPGAEPETIASGIAAPGGLAIDDRGRIIVGQGDGIAPALVGNAVPMASLLRVDPETKAVETYATGLQMSNGVVRAEDGTVYASSDVGVGIDRVAPDGTVQVRWAGVFSANGLEIDRAGRYLYAAQTFQPAAIARIDLQDPSRVETFATPPVDGIAGAPDGMAIDGRDRLAVAANAAGEVWRVDRDRSVCALAGGLPNVSDVAYGHSDRGFSAGRLFAVTFGGVVAEIPAGRVDPADGPPAPTDVPGAAGSPGPAAGSRGVRVQFAPASLRVRGGRATFTPRVTLVRADGSRVRLARRISLPGGRRVRTGRGVTIRVPAGTRTLRVRFVVRGMTRVRTLRLTRG